MIEKAKRSPGKADALMARVAVIADGEGVTVAALERALMLSKMTAREFYELECAVARILEETGAPVRARRVTMTSEPNFVGRDIEAEQAAAQRWRDEAHVDPIQSELGKVGGKKRVQKQTPEERTASARRAALRRWESRKRRKYQRAK